MLAWMDALLAELPEGDPRLFELPHTDRTYPATVGSATHRAPARQAVRESLVLLKNDPRRSRSTSANATYDPLYAFGCDPVYP